MRLSRRSAVVALFLLAPLAQIEAQAPAGAGNAPGGFNPVPYLGSEVDKAKEAYDDAQDDRNLAMEKLRAAAKDYGHAMSRLEVRDNAETEAAFDKAKNAYDAAKADYTKARKRRDDASETFFKIRTAAEKASRANAPPEPPMPIDAPVAGPAAATAPAMTQEEIDAAWHRWTDATIKEWQAQRAERAALDAAEAARKTARAAPTDTAAASAYLDAVKKAQAAAEATEAARAAVPPPPTGPVGTANPSAAPPVETKPAVPSGADADKAQAASDAERAAADDKAWKARAAAQAAADKVAATRAAAKAAPTDSAAGAAYFNALSAARAAADAAAAAKAEADRVWNAHAAAPPHRAAAALSGDEAPIRDDGEDPDDPFSDLNQAALGYWDDEPDPVPTTGGPDDRMVIDDVDHTPAPAAEPNAAAKSGTSKSDPPRTQERPGTSDAVKRTGDAALMRAELEWLAGMAKAWKDAEAEAKAADVALVAAMEEVGAAQAEAKAAHAKKNTAREDVAWDKWRTAIYNRKWARAKAEMKKAALTDIFNPRNDKGKEASPQHGTREKSADDHPHTQERPGTGTSANDSEWRTPSEGTHGLSPQRATTTETSPSAQPTAEQLQRAAQLYPADSAQGGIFIPAPPAPTAPLIATVPVPTRAVQAQTPSTRTAAQIPATSPTPTSTTVPGAATPPTNPGPGQPVSSVTTPVAKPPPSGFGGSWSGDGGCGFTTMTISDQGSSLLLQGLPGNGAISATSDGTTAHAQGVVMYAQPNHQLTLGLSGNLLTFRASSATGSCSESFRRQ